MVLTSGRPPVCWRSPKFDWVPELYAVSPASMRNWAPDVPICL